MIPNTDTTVIESVGPEFVAQFRSLQLQVYATARSKGWWKHRDALEAAAAATGDVGLAEFAVLCNKLSLQMLMVTEVAESTEGLRHGDPPDDKVPEFTASEAELADVVIRIMDMAERYKLRVAEAIVAKAIMNAGRPYMHGGKKA